LKNFLFDDMLVKIKESTMGVENMGSFEPERGPEIVEATGVLPPCAAAVLYNAKQRGMTFSDVESELKTRGISEPTAKNTLMWPAQCRRCAGALLVLTNKEAEIQDARLGTTAHNTCTVTMEEVDGLLAG
jgi:hypothetical protein